MGARRPARPPRTGTAAAAARPLTARSEPIDSPTRHSARRFSPIGAAEGEGGRKRCLSTEPPGQSDSRRSLPSLSTRGQSKAHDSPSCSRIGGGGTPHVLLTGEPGCPAPPLPGRPSAGLETWLFYRVGWAGTAARATRRVGRGGASRRAGRWGAGGAVHALCVRRGLREEMGSVRCPLQPVFNRCRTDVVLQFFINLPCYSKQKLFEKCHSLLYN